MLGIFSPNSKKCLKGFCKAAAQGKTEQLSEWVARGVHINEWGPHGRTALIEAVISRHTATVTELVRLGADPNVLDRMGRSPLRHAVDLQWQIAWNTSMVSVLVRAGADPNYKLDVCGNTLLSEAIQIRNEAAIIELLQYGAKFSSLDWEHMPFEDYFFLCRLIQERKNEVIEKVAAVLPVEGLPELIADMDLPDVPELPERISKKARVSRVTTPWENWEQGDDIQNLLVSPQSWNLMKKF